ncbi:MAG: YdcH family protein [Acidobacteria bacterium]|nr:YdcH family protein [Acidobacteriota bacterium]
MSNDSDAIKELLLRENEEFQRLSQQHHDLESRLLVLSSRSFLSEEEKLEEVTLKKQKLALKDKMADLIRKRQALPAVRNPAGATPPSP